MVGGIRRSSCNIPCCYYITYRTVVILHYKYIPYCVKSFGALSTPYPPSSAAIPAAPLPRSPAAESRRLLSRRKDRRWDLGSLRLLFVVSLCAHTYTYVYTYIHMYMYIIYIYVYFEVYIALYIYTYTYVQ